MRFLSQSCGANIATHDRFNLALWLARCKQQTPDTLIVYAELLQKCGSPGKMVTGTGVRAGGEPGFYFEKPFAFFWGVG